MELAVLMLCIIGVKNGKIKKIQEAGEPKRTVPDARLGTQISMNSLVPVPQLYPCLCLQNQEETRNGQRGRMCLVKVM